MLLSQKQEWATIIFAIVYAAIGILLVGLVDYEYVLVASIALPFLLFAIDRPIVLIGVTMVILSLNQSVLFGGNPLLDIARWIALGLCVLPLIHKILMRKQIRNIYKHDVFSIALITFAFISIFYSIAPLLTFQRSISVILLYVAVFWTGWQLVDENGEQKVIKAVLLVSSSIFIGGIVLIPLNDIVWQSDGRFRGLLTNPNSIGLYTAVFSPLFLWRWLTHRKLLDLLIVLVIIISAILSGSRNGFFVFMLSTVFLLITKSGVPKFILKISFIFTIMAFFISIVDVGDYRLPDNIERLVVVNNVGDGSGRFTFWGESWPIVRSKFLEGHGFGTEDQFQSNYSMLHSKSILARFHNSYLGILFQLGFLGFILLFGPLWYLLFASIFKYRQRYDFPFLRALQAVLLCGLVSAFFESWVYSVGNAFSFPFWLCVMMLIRQLHMDNKPISALNTINA